MALAVLFFIFISLRIRGIFFKKKSRTPIWKKETGLTYRISGVLKALSLPLMAAPAFTAGFEKKAEETFDAKKEVCIKLILGDCRLEKSSDSKIHVHLVYEYDQMENFEFRMEDRGRYINLEEDLKGRNNDGYSRWTVAVPDNTEIEFKSATGNFKIQGLSLDVDASTGTGDVQAAGITLEYEGDFSSGTGDAEVEFPDRKDFELTVSSGTNDAVLMMKGKPIKGYFEFKCHARRGRIGSRQEKTA